MICSLDIETWPIEVGVQCPRIACLSFCREGGDPQIVVGPEAMQQAVIRILDECDSIVGHNIAFDLSCIAVQWPHLLDLIWWAYESDKVLDTMIWCQLSDYAIGVNRHRYGLGDCCDRFGIEHGDKESEWRTRYHELAETPVAWWPEAARTYSLLDALSTLQLAQRLDKVPDVAAQTRWAFWLRLSSALGLMTDTPRVEAWGATMARRANDLRPQLSGFIRDNGTRNMLAIQTAVERAYSGTPPRTPTGRPATDATTCRDSGDPILALYAEYGECLSALNKDLPMLRQPFIHSRYGLAETGRTTSSNPNLQNWNLRNGCRLCVTPREGNVYAIADYGKLELCCLGQLCTALKCGDNMASAIRSGVDPHAMIAAIILDCALADAKAHPDFKMARQSGKIVNFGLPGGMGARSLVDYAWSLYRVRITLTEAERLIKIWRNTWPDIVAYQRYIGRLLEAHCALCGRTPITIEDTECLCGGSIVYGTLDHYRSGRLRGGLSYTQGCNTLFQGLGADVTKAAGWALTRAGYSIVAFVHDEYVIEVPRVGAADAAQHIGEILAEVGREWLPAAPPVAPPTLATRWIKDDPLYDEHGRLQIIDVDRAA